MKCAIQRTQWARSCRSVHRVPNLDGSLHALSAVRTPTIAWRLFRNSPEHGLCCNLLSSLLTRIVYGMTKRKLGHLVMPVRIAAHHSKILWGYGQMEQSLLGSQLVDAGLKDLAQLRVATLVGCPF